MFLTKDDIFRAFGFSHLATFTGQSRPFCFLQLSVGLALVWFVGFVLALVFTTVLGSLLLPPSPLPGFRSFSKGQLPPTFLILMSCSLLYLSVLALNLRTSGEEIMMFGFFRQKLPRIYDSVFNSFLGYCTFEQIAVGFSVAKGLPVRNLQETTTITARKSLWFPQHFEMCKL